MSDQLTPVESSLLFSKRDPDDVRLGDLARAATMTELDSCDSNNVCVLGYPDDEGIRLNGGRPGAAEAPRLIRKFFYRMTPSPERGIIIHEKNIFDLGNIDPTGSLNERHELAQNVSEKVYALGARMVTFGGGHDYGFSDGAAFIEQHRQGLKPLIINLDAHLDVRPNHESDHSGTPFYRLKKKYKNDFDLLEIGLQPQCNSFVHWQWAAQQNIALLSLEAVENTQWACVYDHELIKDLKPTTPVYLSFDMDVLASADAGGCSQAWPTGLRMKDALKFLRYLGSRADLRGLGIYEVSPPHDFDFKTSRAAALLAYYFLMRDRP